MHKAHARGILLLAPTSIYIQTGAILNFEVSQVTITQLQFLVFDIDRVTNIGSVHCLILVLSSLPKTMIVYFHRQDE